MNIQMLKDYFQEFIDGKQHKIMFLNRKKDMFEEFKVIDAINLLEEKDKEIERLNNIIKEVREYIMSELITEWDIKNSGNVSGSDLPVDAITPILEILDKGDNND